MRFAIASLFPRNLSIVVFVYILDTKLVFDNKIKAFEMLKMVRESRVKSFKTYDEAYRFTICGLESTTETEIPVTIISEINGIQSYNNNVNCDKSSLKGEQLNSIIIF